MTTNTPNTTGMSLRTQKPVFSALAVLLILVSLICATGGLVGVLMAVVGFALAAVCIVRARAAWNA
jgi:uncharacterized membrane protein